MVLFDSYSKFQVLKNVMSNGLKNNFWNSDYLNRINEVYVFSIKYRYSDI